jgi:hypothetical protein
MNTVQSWAKPECRRLSGTWGEQQNICLPKAIS